MDMREEFETVATTYIKREGIHGLLQWLATTDFYTAPASARYHGDFEGGLATHSLNVFCRLRDLYRLYSDPYSKEFTKDIEESMAIVALFHDLCKVNYYKVSTRNVKNERTRQWEKVPYYAYDEQFSFGGHGSKSLFLVMNFMKLSPEEAAAINCHMGPWDRQDYGKPGDVFNHNLLAWTLHVADEAATYIDKT